LLSRAARGGRREERKNLMHRLFRTTRAGVALLLIALVGLLAAACDDNAPVVPTPIPPTPRSVAIGPALQTGEPLTLKVALAQALPKAKEWNADALLEVASLQSTEEAPAAGDWLFTFTTPDGQQRALVAVSSVETQVQKLSGTIGKDVADEVQQHAGLVEQMLDSPAVIEKVTALNYQTAGQERIKIAYYTAGADISIDGRANPVVQVRLSKGDTSVQLNLDAVDGSLISKTDDQE
jgi:hypothetical protein